MAAEFSRIEEGADIVFTIRPAAPPRFLAWNIATGIFGGAAFVGSMVGTVGMIIGAGAGAYLARLFFKKAKRGAAPIELRVTNTGLRVRNQSFAPDLTVPLNDIAELLIWDPRSNAPTPSSGGFVMGGTGAMGMGLAATGAIASATGDLARAGIMAMAARQLQIRLRKRSHSKQITIAHFLTEAEAVALVGDIMQELTAKVASKAA